MDWLLEAIGRDPNESAAPTMTTLGPIAFANLSFTDELNRDGSCEFSCRPERLPPEIRSRLFDLAAAPMEVLLRRGSTVLFRGPVWTWGLQGGTLTANCRGLGGYLRYMQVDDDTGDLTFSGIDQHLIARDLVDAWQALAYGNFGLVTSGITASGTTRNRSYLAHERHQTYQRVVELAEVENGFDWHVNPTSRALVLEAQRGTDLSASVHLDLRNITSSDEHASVAAGDVASEAFGVGVAPDTDSPPITSQQGNAALRATFGRTGISETFDGVSQQGTLNAHTRRLRDDRATMHVQPGPGLMPVTDADVADFGTGDMVSYVYDAGLGVRERTERVVSKRVQVDEGGGVDISVEFG